MTAQTGFAVTQPVKPRLQDRDRGVWRTTRNVAQPRPEKAIMDTRTLDFGFLPEPLSIEAGPVTIRPLDHLEKAVAGVMTCPEIVGDWLYSPMAKGSDGKGGLKDLPYPSRIFRMPTTHSLAHDSCDDSDQLTFLLWVVSFFKGIRLTAEEAGFLDATSIKTGLLVDFVPLANSLQTGIAMADAFWIQHRANPKCTKLVAGIVHALFLSQNPQSLQFERFTLLYQALDACFALSSLLAPVSKYLAHGARVAFMCRKFDMPVPEWARTK